MVDISDRTSAWNALHSPATDEATLAAIAGTHPEFAAQIAAHPRCYPELRAWAEAQDLPAHGGASTSAATPNSSSRGWWLAFVLVMLLLPSVAAFIRATDESGYGASSLLTLLLTGGPYLLLIVVSIVTAPTAGRKVGSTVFAVLALAVVVSPWLSPSWLFFGYPLVGLVAVLVFFAWAIARPLRGAGYAAVALVVVLHGGWYFLWRAIGYTFYRAGGPLLPVAVYAVANALIVTAVVICALAWSRGADRRAIAAAQSAAASASARTYGGYVGSPVGTTNTMAVLSLVFAFVFSILGVVFGHVALAQIRRTGEAGRGLAVAGLVIGYISVGIGVAIAIVYIAVLAEAVGRSSYY